MINNRSFYLFLPGCYMQRLTFFFYLWFVSNAQSGGGNNQTKPKRKNTQERLINILDQQY
jgi:hypothetical protein